MMSAENGETAVGTPPPPAYESIQFSRDGDGADALPDVPRGDGSGFITNERVEVSVTNPTKVGDGLTAYAVYTVSTKNDDPAYKKDQSIVVRRYSDFQWLRGRLSTLYPGIVLFPLPEKTVTTSPFQSDFLEHRRSGLETFLKKVVEHPVLATCEDVVMFLEEQGGSSWDQRAPWYSRGAMGTALGAMDSWFQSIGTATETWSTGAGMESVMMEEDPSYLEATEYLLLLEERLKRALKSGSEIVNSVHNLGILTGTFGENAHHLGDCEEKGAKILLGEQAGGLGQAFRQVGAAACTMRAPTEAQAERLAKRFRAPLRQSLQYVRAAKEQIDARLDALLKLQACRAKVQSKRAKLEQALHAPPTPPPIPPTTIFERLSAAVHVAHPGHRRGITTRRRSRRIRRRRRPEKVRRHQIPHDERAPSRARRARTSHQRRVRRSRRVHEGARRDARRRVGIRVSGVHRRRRRRRVNAPRAHHHSSF